MEGREARYDVRPFSFRKGEGLSVYSVMSMRARCARVGLFSLSCLEASCSTLIYLHVSGARGLALRDIHAAQRHDKLVHTRSREAPAILPLARSPRAPCVYTQAHHARRAIRARVRRRKRHRGRGERRQPDGEQREESRT